MKHPAPITDTSRHEEAALTELEALAAEQGRRATAVSVFRAERGIPDWVTVFQRGGGDGRLYLEATWEPKA